TGQVEVVGTALLAFARPLVEAARRDETPAGQEGVAERRARPQTLGPHVDDEAARAGPGHDAPPRPGEPAPAPGRSRRAQPGPGPQAPGPRGPGVGGGRCCSGPRPPASRPARSPPRALLRTR